MPAMMCKNEDCLSRLTCYRFTAQPGPDQRYHAYEIRGKYSICCDAYWPAREAAPADYKTEQPLRGNRTGNTGGLTHVVREARERGRYR